MNMQQNFNFYFKEDKKNMKKGRKEKSRKKKKNVIQPKVIPVAQ